MNEPSQKGAARPARVRGRTRLAIAVLAGGLMLLAGCATQAPRFAVEINALSTLPPKTETTEAAISQAGTRYLLLPGDPEQDARDLQHREFEEVLEAALATRGLERVDVASAADIAILMNYGIGERETRIISYSRPYHVNDDLRFYGRGRYLRGHRGRRGIGYYPYPYSAFDRYTLQQETRTVTTVNRFLELEALAISPGTDPRDGDPVWATQARSRGPIDDLRRVFPVLVGAAAEHVGTDSGQIIETTIAEDDERVIKLRPMFDPTGAALRGDARRGDANGSADATEATGGLGPAVSAEDPTADES